MIEYGINFPLTNLNLEFQISNLKKLKLDFFIKYQNTRENSRFEIRDSKLKIRLQVSNPKS